MKITINLTNKEIEHIKNHTFYDSCDCVDNIMRKVQKESNKKYNVRGN
jgi:hypothetical protein